MIILFSDEEMKWLDHSQYGNWKIKPDAPKEIKESLQKKLEEMKKHRY